MPRGLVKNRSDLSGKQIRKANAFSYPEGLGKQQDSRLARKLIGRSRTETVIVGLDELPWTSGDPEGHVHEQLSKWLWIIAEH